MVIYTYEDPTVLLVGSVIEVVRYDGDENEYLLLHRYGYASQKQAAWNLDYTKSFLPGYIDRKDDSYVFTFKPRKAWEKVEHHYVVSGNVKAKFVLTKTNHVPPTALSGGGTAALNTAVQQPVQVSAYELRRGQRMKDNNDKLLSLGLIDLAKQISIEHEPVKRAKTTIKKGKSSEPGPRRASRRLAAGNDSCDSEHDGELPDCQATRTKNDEGGEDDEDDEDDEDEEDEEDEDEEED